MLRPLLGLLVAATMVPVAAATTDQFAPSSVVLSSDSPLGTTLAWTRGVAEADAYRVYGFSTNHVPTFLVEVPAGDDATWVLGDMPSFADYGVAGVRGGVESVIQEALSPSDGPDGDAGECVRVMYEPPTIMTQCGPYVSIPPHLPVGAGSIPSSINLIK